MEKSKEPVSHSMRPLTRRLTLEEAAHLGRRTIVGGPTYKQIKKLSRRSNARVAVRSLLKLSMPPEEPLTFMRNENLKDPFGEVWWNRKRPGRVDKKAKKAATRSRVKSYKGWIGQKMMDSEMTIHSRMFLFWINHFGVRQTNRDCRMHYKYASFLMKNALGNFKEIMEYITIDPEMLFFLNGHQSGRNGSQPNENYGREFLELYTIGKGPRIGPGDYTNYTDSDVSQAARVFSGWEVKNPTDSELPVFTPTTTVFVPENHDNGVKKFSSHFDGKEIKPIPGKENEEYRLFIDMVFNNEKFGYFLCEELYTFFVGIVTDKVRQKVIPEMQKVFTQNGRKQFNLKPVLELLLSSEHFYDVALRGCMVKSPYEYVYSLFLPAHVDLSEDIETRYSLSLAIILDLERAGQSTLKVTSVAGWDAYHQEPTYYREWVDAVKFESRIEFARRRLGSRGYTKKHFPLRPNGFKLLENLSNPADLNKVIDDICLVYFPVPLGEEDKNSIREELAGMLSPKAWEFEYKAAKTDPGGEQEKAINGRMIKVLQKMGAMYGFEMMGCGY